MLLDPAVYPITLALKLFGPIETVEASLVRTANGVDSHANLQLGHTSGGQSQLTASLNNLLSNTAVIAGPAGSITLEPPLVGAEQVTIRRMKPMGDAPSGDLSPTKLQKLLQELRSVSALRSLRRYLSDGSRDSILTCLQVRSAAQHVLGLLDPKSARAILFRESFLWRFSVSLTRHALAGPRYRFERNAGMKIAYPMNTYPMTSTTFVRREIEALEQARPRYQTLRHSCLAREAGRCAGSSSSSTAHITC